jgi:hypothetical protein
MERTARGRYETKLGDPDWVKYPDGSESAIFFFGDEEDGLAVAPYYVPPTYTAPVHYHKTHYMSFIVSGTLTVGKTTYGPGDIRLQEKGSIYGPEQAGPDGCYMLNIFADRRGALPTFLGGEEMDAEITPTLVLRHIWNELADRAVGTPT